MKAILFILLTQVMDGSQNENKTEDDMHTDDVQKRINKHSHLKVVQLITNITKDVLVDVLKARLSSANFGYALNGMKNRILPQLNNYGRHLLYPDVSSYSGDLSDLDISLLYIILRNLNTISPHSNGWGNMPKDDDRTLSANIDRIRFYKNKYVSHCSNQSLDEQDFLKIWKEIRHCIIELGAAEYKSKIDFLFTSEINPVMEQELLNTLRRLKKTEEQYESYYFKIKEDLNEIKEHLCMTNMKPADTKAAFNASLGSVALELKIEGSNIPSVEEIKKRTNDLSSDDMRVTSVKEGSIIIGLKVSASAVHTVRTFIGKIDTLLSKLLQMYPHYGNGHTSSIVASLNFMDEQNVSIGFPILELVGTKKPHILTAQEYLELRNKRDKQFQRSLQITGEQDMAYSKALENLDRLKLELQNTFKDPEGKDQAKSEPAKTEPAKTEPAKRTKEKKESSKVL